MKSTMKSRMILTLLIIIVCLVAACSNQETVYDVHHITANIKVVDKLNPEQREEGDYWISVVYLEGANKEVMKLKLDNRSVWNLIEMNKAYTAHFTQDSQGEYRLHEIDPFK